MDDIRKHELIIEKLKEVYGDLDNLKTNNEVLHTRIFTDISDFRINSIFKLKDSELPVLECGLNKNYILATTKSLYSIYNNTKYEMEYQDFLKSDRKYFFKNADIAAGNTRVFKYYLKDGSVFFYEIDSLYPADIIHNTIVLSKRFQKYDET
ncbi:hypothetical protein ATE84_1617 [Aquimarina sp. MAR_2010_214]|uniref:hypothetical protein n=1 Tax=Aquimarina sp. MAR_2010_214 TaxID=1250026 RepID=UPI000C6FF2F8|nr:hypothetical protein [Aquimarina sp. MAR_2010_214]PKV49586.1 hypothetical protein ATE84_1617 [Aquimarina sp. MAR_2010_214]